MCLPGKTPSAPSVISDSNLCLKLEELILDPCADGSRFDIQHVIGLAVKRVSWRREKLESFRIASWDQSVQAGALKLGEYVLHVVKFEGLECAFASFLSSIGSLAVHLELYTSRLVGCLLGELDNQLHRL